MSQSKFRLLNEDDLRLRVKEVRQRRLRLALMVILTAFGLGLLALSFLPLMANHAMPLIWVYEAEQHGFTEQLRDTGLRLLANGRIEVLPKYFSWISGSIGSIFLWLGCLMINNRKDRRWFGNAFTRAYWTSFYGLKPREETLIHVKGAPLVRRARTKPKVKDPGHE